jgi:hypothetical protein
MTSADDSDGDWDEFMDKFTEERYKNGFSEDNWEEVTSKNIVYTQNVSVCNVGNAGCGVLALLSC